MAQIPTPILLVVAFFGGICFILGMLVYWKNKYEKRGIRLSIKEMCYFSIRKTLKEELLSAMELADKNKFYVKPHYLEAHMLAGGDPHNLIKIIVDGKAQGETIQFKEAATMDLGKVSLQEARKLYEKFEKS